MNDNLAKHVYNENIINIRKTTKYANIPFFIGQAYPKIHEKCRVFFLFCGIFRAFFGSRQKFFFGCKPLSNKPFVGSPEK